MYVHCIPIHVPSNNNWTGNVCSVFITCTVQWIIYMYYVHVLWFTTFFFMLYSSQHHSIMSTAAAHPPPPIHPPLPDSGSARYKADILAKTIQSRIEENKTSHSIHGKVGLSIYARDPNRKNSIFLGNLTWVSAGGSVREELLLITCAVATCLCNELLNQDDCHK